MLFRWLMLATLPLGPPTGRAPVDYVDVSWEIGDSSRQCAGTVQQSNAELVSLLR